MHASANCAANVDSKLTLFDSETSGTLLIISTLGIKIGTVLHTDSSDSDGNVSLIPLRVVWQQLTSYTLFRYTEPIPAHGQKVDTT